MELIGILIIVVGFALRLDTVAIVLAAGVVTGFISGMGLVEILSVLGKAFVDTRYVSLFLLTLGVIGILERNGLRERAAFIVQRFSRATSGKILSLYMFIRIIFSALHIRIGGHVQFVRPLIYPMIKGAHKGELSEKDDDKLKGVANAVENYGNFFGQNIFLASPGVLLVVGTLGEAGINVDSYYVALASIPIALCAVFYSVGQNYWLDRRMKQ